MAQTTAVARLRNGSRDSARDLFWGLAHLSPIKGISKAPNLSLFSLGTSLEGVCLRTREEVSSRSRIGRVGRLRWHGEVCSLPVWLLPDETPDVDLTWALSEEQPRASHKSDACLGEASVDRDSLLERGAAARAKVSLFAQRLETCV